MFLASGDRVHVGVFVAVDAKPSDLFYFQHLLQPVVPVSLRCQGGELAGHVTLMFMFGFVELVDAAVELFTSMFAET